MRWPWVSRKEVLADFASLGQAELDRAYTTIATERARYDSLLDKYHTLKVNGASIPEPPKTLERPEFDPVMAAITAKAGPDRKLRAMMAAEAKRAQNAGVDEVEIIRAIEQGVTIDDEEGVVL